MKRIQRKRTKGWRMPSNTIYVGRPTKYGNPFRLIDGMMFYYCVNRTILSPWIIYDNGKNDYMYEDVIGFYKMWIMEKLTDEIGLPPVPDIEELRGKDLACWCKPMNYCHVDVLIELLSI